jgi:hypothetical protein
LWAHGGRGRGGKHTAIPGKAAGAEEGEVVGEAGEALVLLLEGRGKRLEGGLKFLGLAAARPGFFLNGLLDLRSLADQALNHRLLRTPGKSRRESLQFIQ